jgi:Secretion system C-terminal sorting domain
MKKYLRNSQLLLPVLIVSLFFCTAALGQKTWTRGAGNDNWSSANNWNPVGVPTAGDEVIIPDNALFTFVNVDINASCASLTINGGVHPLTVTIKEFKTFNVTNTSGGTGLISIGAPADGSSKKSIIVGEPFGPQTPTVLNCVGITMADVILPFTDYIVLNIRSGNVVISGNLTLNGSGTENSVSILGGKLVIGGTFNNGGSLLTTSESIVEYNGSAQVMRSDTYSNLTVSGSGAKSGAVTVRVKLSIQGTATVINTITYTSNQTYLEYKGSRAQITSNVEFPVNMPARVIIDNPAGVGLNSNKTIAEKLVLMSGNLIAGNKLSMGAAGTPTIERENGSMTGTLQSPANDYNVSYTGNSITTGPELSGGGLKNIYVQLYNPLAMETVTLNQNCVPDGDIYISYGTFNLSAFTINRSAAGGVLTVTNAAILKIGGTNSLPLNYTYDLGESAVIEYAGTNQTVIARNYTNFVASGSGIKTVSTAADTYISGQLTVQPGAVLTVGGANFTVVSNTNISGTLNSTSTTGYKFFNRIYINSGGLFNSAANEDYIIQGNLEVNGTGSIISGSGTWHFSPLNQTFLKGTGAAAITNAIIYGDCINAGADFSFSNLTIGIDETAYLANLGTISVSATMGGPGSFHQHDNATLNYSGVEGINLLPSDFIATATGNTVNYNRNGQQKLNRSYVYANLKLSGSGTKVFYLGTSVNGVLSIQGSATTSNAFWANGPTFGPQATLEYAGTAPQTSTDIEFKSTGGPKNLIINNPSGVTLHASRTIDGTVTLANGILNLPAPNILTIANGNAIGGTGFGTAKHINTQVTEANQGFLRVDKIAANSPYLFPLGSGNYYLPCTLIPTDIIANNTFSAAVFEGITDNGLPNGNAITDKSNTADAVWTINNNISSTTLPVDITLGWSGLEGVNFSALADNLIGIAHYDNPAWGDFTGSGNQLNNTAARSGVTTFSPFAVGKLGSFYASALTAAPQSSAIAKAAILKTPAHTAIAKGLNSSYKKTTGKKDMHLVNVFPNPVSNKAQLRFAVSSNDKVALTITAADGKTVYSKTINLLKGENIIILDVSAFLKGTYFVKSVFDDGQVAATKFIK